MRAGLTSGETIALVGGGGGLGHLGLQFAKALGLQVVAIHARDEGLSVEKECGADIVIDARKEKEKAVKAVKKVTAGQGADATLNFSDHDAAATLGAAVTKMHRSSRGLKIEAASSYSHRDTCADRTAA